MADKYFQYGTNSIDDIKGKAKQTFDEASTAPRKWQARLASRSARLPAM